MSNFDFTDLILLVGTNPLPNYVVGKWFLKQKKEGNCAVEKIWLLYTSKTEKYAENLKTEFKKENITVETNKLRDEASGFKIRRDFTDLVLKNLQNKSVHLNYTGGTKSMSVHTYISLLKQSIESSENEFNIQASYSYLNARGFNLMSDASEQPLTGDLRKKFDLSLGTLIGLHGMKKINPDDKYKSDLLDTIKEITKINVIEELKFPKESTRKPVNSYKYLIDKKEDLFDCHGFSPSQKTLLSKLPSNLAVYSKDGIAKKSLNNENIKYAIQFLDGKWLELYIEHIILNKIKINDVVFDAKNLNTGWEIRDPKWSEARYWDNSFMIKFELDVLLLFGYQFFGISCTTSQDRALCKSKGFEIMHRSKQIGGDESKAILITFLSNQKAKDGNEITPEDLQKELETDTGGEGNILVLGSNDLRPNILAKKIEDFIKK